jgi:thiamine-phosphate pyrophosphorylase
LTSPNDQDVELRNIDWSLYAIMDREWFGKRDLEEIAIPLMDGGVGVIQYRDKVSETGEMLQNALVLRRLTRNRGVPLVINDRLDIALAAEADGVHVGQKDMPIEVIRRLAPGMLIGLSIGSFEEFEIAPAVDYYGVGAVFQTDTKKIDNVPGLDLVRKIRKHTNLPILGIGGVTPSNAEEVIRAGCDGVAAISSLLGAKSILHAAKSLIIAIHRAKSEE